MRKLLNMIIFSAERTISYENIIAFKKIICAEKMFSIKKTNSYGEEFV
jgi:hypothetical protein